VFIAVIDQNEECRLVSTERLDELITTSEIKQFLRLAGWVMIGCEPLRGRGKEWVSGERRQRFVSFHGKDLLNIKLAL
jgi:hypothetical protein